MFLGLGDDIYCPLCGVPEGATSDWEDCWEPITGESLETKRGQNVQELSREASQWTNDLVILQEGGEVGFGYMLGDAFEGARGAQVYERVGSKNLFIAVHHSCWLLAKTRRGVSLAFEHLWPLLGDTTRPFRLRGVPYGGILRYHSQWFDIRAFVAAPSRYYMMNDPQKISEKSTQNAERILKIIDAICDGLLLFCSITNL